MASQFELGHLPKQKTSNNSVTQFGKKMADDHTKALDEGPHIAQAFLEGRHVRSAFVDAAAALGLEWRERAVSDRGVRQAHAPRGP
jgi:hypothetical protein